MNTSHRTNSAGRGQTSGRGRSRGGRSRGNHDTGYPSVPTIQEVTSGAFVSIVLKVDQQTGRQVQGIVADLLTRGNHPRGIKVRLQDGRVGRVQRMASEREAQCGSEGLSGLGRNEEHGSPSGEMGEMQSSTMGLRVGGFTGRKYGDYRLDAPDEPPTSKLSLEDYIVTKGNKKGRRGKNAQSSEPDRETVDNGQANDSEDDPLIKSTTSVCPVCGEFEGDEVAVAHHVNGHFD